MDKRDTKVRGHLRYFLRDAKIRAKKKLLPLNIDIDYLESIITDKCPVFNTPFTFGLSGRGLKPESPSLDRVVPQKGYVKGNVVFISHRANSMKHNASSADELRKVADWMEDRQGSMVERSIAALC